MFLFVFEKLLRLPIDDGDVEDDDNDDDDNDEDDNDDNVDNNDDSDNDYDDDDDGSENNDNDDVNDRNTNSEILSADLSPIQIFDTFFPRCHHSKCRRWN